MPYPDESDEKASTKSGSQHKWAVTIGASALLLSMIPYLIGQSFAGNRHFMWLGYNFDDSCVYLSWMRQAADGSHRALNLFTTEPQHGMEMNPLFLVMGLASRWLHLPLAFVNHASRILFGAILLVLVWQLIIRTTQNCSTRRLAFVFVCIGSGLGWLPGLWPDHWPGPIDALQPEAVTYLALYLSPLFCFSMALQVASVLLFMQAVQTARARYAIFAGLAVFLLGLTHTYDVVTMLAVFAAYTIATFFSRDPIRIKGACLYAIVTGAIALPSVLYIKHQLETEHVFHERMEVRTASGPIVYLLIGFGLPLLMAVFYVVDSRKVLFASDKQTDIGRSPDAEPITPHEPSDRNYQLFLIAWLIVNIAISYAPIKICPWQRKMLQGAHIPIAILGGMGAAVLLTRIRPAVMGRILQAAVASVAILILSMSNIRFMLRDMESFEIDLIQTTHMHRPYLNVGEMQAMQWIEANTPEDAAIQPLPWLVSDGGSRFAPIDMTLACVTPGLVHRKVYCGHWGETPDYQTKLSELVRFALPAEKMPDEARIALLRKMRVGYIVYSEKQPNDETADRLAPMFRGKLPLPSYLVLVYSNADADVYKVQLP